MLGIIPLVPGLAAPTQILGRPRLARSSEEAVEERSLLDVLPQHSDALLCHASAAA